MSQSYWKKEICTIPNLLSLFRLLLIPVYLKIYLHAEKSYDFILAGTILALSCLTDLADGIIAREFHMISKIGKILDPLADKLTQFFLLLSLSEKHRMLYPMLALFTLKELFQMGFLLFFAQKGKVLSGALNAGKLCTAALFISLTMLVLFPQLDNTFIFVLVLSDTVLLFYAFYNYYLAYFGRNTKLIDLEAD